MPDFTRVVEFLRDIRQGPLQSVNDEITQLAADYAQLCVQANERLRQCSAFLQQGLRTEAIHLADESPNLLDFVAALDLPDQQAWAEFCQNNGLAVPPPLQLERAGQLNEAYAQDQPLEHLMAHHRLLALSRSPIRQRLDTLRKIAEVDTAGSGAWEKDIRIFEKARLKELPSAFHRAVKSHDNGTITNLMDEIGKQNWYEAVPADLVSAVTDAFSRVQKAGVEAQLQKLVEPLRDAYAARSLQECQALVQRWKNIMSTGGVTQVSSELTDEIRPVVAFVNEQIKREDYLKRFRDSCKAFTRMLDDDAPDAQLEAGFAELRDFKEEIPDDITRRYAAKKTGRRQTIERSHKVRLVTIASLAAAVIVVVLVVIKLMQSSGAARAVAQTIDGDLVQHSQAGLSAAERYVDGLQKSNPGILKEPNVGAAVARMQTQRGDFDSNTRTLELQLKSGDEALAAAAPVMANRTAPITEVASAATLAQKSFNDLSAATAQLAWVDSDNRLPAMTTNLKAALDSLKERANSAATSELEKLAADLQAIPQNASTPEAVGDAHNRINALRDRLTAIRNIPLLTDDTTKVLAALAQQITDRESGAMASGTVAAELQNIRTHAASAADLQLALESFVARFPKDPRAADFKAALTRLPFAAGLDSWLQMAAGFAKNSPDTVAAAQKRVDAITAFLTANPTLPLTAAANTYVDYLKHFIDAHAEKGVWQTTFTDLLASPLLAELNFMEISDGRRYYTLGPINRVEHRINNEVSVSFDVLNPKDLTKRTTITIDPPATVPAEPEPAPHTKVVADIAQSLKEINSGNWDTFGIELADSLAKNDLIDPVVKAILLQAAIKGEKDVTTWGGTSPVESDYAGALSRWESQKLGDLAWYDPNKISDTTRKNLKAIVDNLPPSAAEIPKITAAKAAIVKALTLTIAGTGVLLKDDNGAWGLSCAITPQDGDSLVIIQPGGDASTPGTLQSIGSITGGKAALDAPALRDVPQGTLFYLIREHP